MGARDRSHEKLKHLKAERYKNDVIKFEKGINKMNEVVKINNNDLQIKIWNGQKVVTLADVDKVHERPEGTARRNFNENKRHLIIEEDYYLITRKELSTKIVRNDEPLKGNPNIEVILLTESGYLLLVKSFTDDLAWQVQRQLVNTYFKFKEVIETLEPTENGLVLSEHQFENVLDAMTSCAAIFQNMIEYSTINYKQQQELLQVARKRVNYLLGGARSEKYKKWSRIYFKNLWQDFCSSFNCGSYKDLNPLYMADSIAENWIKEWEYIEK